MSDEIEKLRQERLAKLRGEKSAQVLAWENEMIGRYKLLLYETLKLKLSLEELHQNIYKG